MATKEVVQTTKTVAVYNSANNSLVEIQVPSSVSKRSELEQYLTQNSIAHENTTMIIGETTTGLVSPDSSIPEGNFTLMLSPKKVKSGVHGYKNASFSEMRNFIKEEVRKNAQKVKVHFGNYTQLSTEALRAKITSYFPSKIKVAAPMQKTVVSKKATVSKSAGVSKKVSSPKQAVISTLQRKLAKVDVTCCKK